MKTRYFTYLKPLPGKPKPARKEHTTFPRAVAEHYALFMQYGDRAVLESETHSYSSETEHTHDDCS